MSFEKYDSDNREFVSTFFNVIIDVVEQESTHVKAHMSCCQ